MRLAALDRLPAALLLLLNVLSTCSARSLSVLAIDYGADSFKASLIKPGIPFDVLLNRDSKRKTPSALSLRGEERRVGGDAQTLATRFPQDSVSAVKLLLGDNAAQLELHRALASNVLLQSDRGTHTVAFSSGANHTVEEILAMQFASAAEMAKVAGKETVSEVIVTVPAFFEQAERQAILDAIELAGLKPLSLLNDGTAVAINYAIPRTFSGHAEVHIFYDAGAAAVRATAVSFKTVVDQTTGKNATQIDVLGVGWDRSAGGLAFDARLRDVLVQRFEQQSGGSLSTPLRSNHRAMAKLLKEASRVKHVLSANIQAQARIEALADDIDFRAIVTREEMEAVWADFAPLLSRPITDALAMAKIPVVRPNHPLISGSSLSSLQDGVASVVLVGGHSRVPMVQEAVKQIVAESKIAQNINADEAAVMGAALHGAALSRQFRTKDIRIADIGLDSVALQSEAPIVSADGSAATVLFPAGSRLGTTQLVSFNASHDFSFALVRPGQVAADSVPLLTASVRAPDLSSHNMTVAELANATTEVVIELADDGRVRVASAQFVRASSPVKNPSVAGRLFDGLFGGSKAADPSASASASTEPEADLPVVAPAPVPSAFPLTFEITNEGIKPLSKTEKLEAKKRLRELEQAETRIKNREEARNSLEGLLYRLRDESEGEDFTRCSTTDERAKLSELLSTTSEWLFDAGESAPVKDLRQRRTDLEKLARPVRARLSEEKSRPNAVTDFQIALFQGRAFLISASANATEAEQADEPRRHTVEELDALRKLLDDEQAWLKALEDGQAKLGPTDDPLLRTAELERRASTVNTEVTRLGRKPKPRKPRVTSSTTSATSTPAASADTETPTAAAEADSAGASRINNEL